MKDTISKAKNYNDIWLILLAIIHTYLFYEQRFGINYLIFSVLVVIGFSIQNNSVIKKPSFLLASMAALLTGASCFYYGTGGYTLVNYFSILILAAIAISPKSSFIIAAFHSLFTMLCSPYFIIKKILKSGDKKTNYSKILKYILLSTVPMVVVAVFTFIYANSNPILEQFIANLNLEFLDIQLFFYCGYSMWLAFIIIHQQFIDKMRNWDIENGNNIDFEENMKSKLSFLKLDSEIYIVTTLFILLNLVLALNNGLDIYYLFVKGQMPENITFSDYIHKGVYALIFSIVLAISIIMYTFSSRMNFVQNASKIKLLVYIWIIQNLALIYLCVYKNWHYIEAYGYTYKRLGVYFFLFLSTIGLLLTVYKLLKNKNNIYLIRRNSWIIYLSTILFFCYDWDVFIAERNIENFGSTTDLNYLVRLDETNLPQLYNHVIKNEEAFHYLMRDSDSFDFNHSYHFEWYGHGGSCPEFEIAQKMKRLHNEVHTSDWQSYCYSKSQIANQFSNLNMKNNESNK